MAKVSIVRCEDYEANRVFAAVKRAVDLVGGIGEFVKPGMKVLLKPNLLSARPPEDAVDTHPEVVRAILRLVKSAGGEPMIGDSPGGFTKDIDEILEISGMTRVAKEEGAEIVKFTSSRHLYGIPIARHVLDCDCMISIPKLKTHCITVLTAAIKNTFGTVTGLYKAECHAQAPKEEEFAKIIAKVHSISKPNLNVLDGILAMEGDGPSSGDLRKMSLVMAGCDGVAIDSCLAKIVGIDPGDVLVTKEAYDLGLGEMDMALIEVLGDDIASFVVKDFKLPQTTPLKLVPRGIAKAFAAMIRLKPSIEELTCRQCNLCRLSCPVDAIDIDKGNYRIDYKACIRCMCCHEVCPYRAIQIKQGIFTKWVWGK